MTQDCSVFPFLMARVGGRGGAKAGDSVGNLALWTMPPNWTDPRATALTKVELSLTNLIGFFFFFFFSKERSERSWVLLGGARKKLPRHERPGTSQKSLVSSSYDSVEVTRHEITGQIADGSHSCFHPLTERSRSLDRLQTVADVTCCNRIQSSYQSIRILKRISRERSWI